MTLENINLEKRCLKLKAYKNYLGFIDLIDAVGPADFWFFTFFSLLIFGFLPFFPCSFLFSNFY